MKARFWPHCVDFKNLMEELDKEASFRGWTRENEAIYSSLLDSWRALHEREIGLCVVCQPSLIGKCKVFKKCRCHEEVKP